LLIAENDAIYLQRSFDLRGHHLRFASEIWTVFLPSPHPIQSLRSPVLNRDSFRSCPVPGRVFFEKSLGIFIAETFLIKEDGHLYKTRNISICAPSHVR